METRSLSRGPSARRKFLWTIRAHPAGRVRPVFFLCPGPCGKTPAAGAGMGILL